MGVRIHLRHVAAWLGFGVDVRHYDGGKEGKHHGKGSVHHSPAKPGAFPLEASVFYQWLPPKRVSVVHPTSFDEALVLADHFKRQQVVILNLQGTGEQLSRRMVDFCAGLAYASDGQIQIVADQLFLLTPRDVEVSDEKRKRLAERRFFNRS